MTLPRLSASLQAVPPTAGRIGICQEHGWWFDADDGHMICPEPGCRAPVDAYIFEGTFRDLDGGGS